MINSTSGIILCSDLGLLRDSFCKIVFEASEFDKSRRVQGLTKTRLYTLDKILSDRLLSIGEMSGSDFQNIFEFIQKFTAREWSSTELEPGLKSLALDKPKLTHRIIASRWLKFVYLRLWVEGHIIFPLNFKIETAFTKDEIRTFLPPILTCHFEQNSRDIGAFGVNLTLATSWRSFEEIELDELGPFSLLLSRDTALRLELGLTRRSFFTPFTAAIRMWQRAGTDSGFRYSNQDIEAYLYWMQRSRHETLTMKPSEFFSEADQVKAGQRKRPKILMQRRRAAAQLSLIEVENRDELKREIIDGTKTLIDIELETIAKGVLRPDDITAYANRLRRGGVRRQTGSNYPGTGFSTNNPIWKTWSGYFERYFEDRGRRGFERLDQQLTTKYIFQDFLCCYLPWARQLIASNDVNIPKTPFEFSRYVHWTSDSSSETKLLGLLPFFERTRNGSHPAGLNNFISDAYRFFEFCADQRRDGSQDSTLWANPVSIKIDRRLERGLPRTNKLPLPKLAFPLLMRYAYACENFYSQLIDRSLSGRMSNTELALIRGERKRSGSLDPAWFGIELNVEYEGRCLPLSNVPMLATWEYSQIRNDAGEVETVFLPRISGFRLVIAALETGIRFQGLQWLCQRTYRSLVPSSVSDAGLVPLVVSTDKVREAPWRTLIIRRAFEVLVREEQFQARLADGMVERLVGYEKNENSRFSPVLPLFRGPRSDYPLSDRVYVVAWEKFLTAFAPWYRQSLPGAEPLSMWEFEAELDRASNQPRIVLNLDKKIERAACPVRLKFKHTPHSARSTFISNRSGVLPIELTAWLVGHTNKATTYYYTVGNEAEIEQKVLAAANRLWTPDAENPVHIRADAVDSALRKSFSNDRHKTESAFGLQSISLLNEDSLEKDGVAMLRTTPMANIAFRETHICPVGEFCPSDILDVIVEPRRCGICPIAVKGVDHLPAITAKMRSLLEQIQESTGLIDRMQSRGEPSLSVDEIHQRRRIDVTEYEGWRTSLEALTARLGELGDAAPDLFHVGMPDAVRLHLKLVTRDTGIADFILQRVDDSSALRF